MEWWVHDEGFKAFCADDNPPPATLEAVAALESVADGATAEPFVERSIAANRRDRETLRQTKRLPEIVGVIAQTELNLRQMRAYEQHLRNHRDTARRTIADREEAVSRVTGRWPDLPHALMTTFFIKRRTRRMLVCVCRDFRAAGETAHLQRLFEIRASGFTPFAMGFWNVVARLRPGHEMAEQRVRVLETAWFSGRVTAEIRQQFAALDIERNGLRISSRPMLDLMRHSERVFWDPEDRYTSLRLPPCTPSDPLLEAGTHLVAWAHSITN
jgi:hypothetical protein